MTKPTQLKCIKEFVMLSGEVAFITGKSYEISDTTDDWDSNEIEFIVESEISTKHTMPWDELVQKHFELVT